MAIVVTYRRTVRLSMRIVKNGDVHVSAPIGMPRREVEAFINEHQEWIEGARKRTVERQERQAAFYNQLPLNTRAQKADAAAQLNAIVEPMLERHSREMGVSPKLVRYRAMKTRWGVCKCRERVITFSLYLLLLPDWCIEHVVVHELCHLLEPSHSPRFHSLMDKYYPNWRAARKVIQNSTKGDCPLLCQNDLLH